MNCKEIIEKYLRENGFDGIINNDCCCPVDDLASCFSDCEPAHLGESGLLYPGE